MLSLKAALAQSINTVTARLIDRVGPKPVIELIDKMGVDTENILEAPSIALGTPDVSLFEMVGAYSAFANEGVYIKPTLPTTNCLVRVAFTCLPLNTAVLGLVYSPTCRRK